MKLYIGGAYRGKSRLVLEKYGFLPEDTADGNVCSIEDLMRAPVIDHFHMFVKRALRDDTDISDLAENLCRCNPEVIVISNELGCGIVPADKDDRRWRECTGRILCELAAFSEEVWRVVCGIRVPLKERGADGEEKTGTALN